MIFSTLISTSDKNRNYGDLVGIPQAAPVSALASGSEWQQTKQKHASSPQPA